MLFHPNPHQILVLSGGAGGMINEILKHPTTERVDYAELDPLFLDLLQIFLTPLTQQELGDPNVSVKNEDGRMFVQGTSNRYDQYKITINLYKVTMSVNQFATAINYMDCRMQIPIIYYMKTK